MKIKKLILENFRNHKSAIFDLNGETALIVGDNGTGKTNILEAVSMLSTGKSSRATYDRDVITHKSDHARIAISADLNEDNYNLELYIIKSERSENSSTKKAKINKTKKSITKFSGTINTVLFTPHDVELFTQSPSKRREYLDQILFQVDTNYKRAHKKYQKAKRQRNKLLEKIREFDSGEDQLPYWDEKIIQTGKIIQKKREEFLNFAQSKIPEHSLDLNAQEVIYKITYKKNIINKKRVKEKRRSEIGAARTLIGPHRDDFSIKYNDHEISSYGSRGQKRTTILALKLCEIDFINKSVGKRPILLLDDIFSELDQKHKSAITNIIDLQQTLITTADRGDLKNNIKTIYL